MQKYVVYAVRGIDKLGSFEVIRRYSDFTALRSVLLQRWPGCFVPPLPPKKVVGNMDAKFIEERRLFLDLFLKKVATLKWLWYSEEVDIFIRSNSNDIEKTLGSLPKSTY